MICNAHNFLSTLGPALIGFIGGIIGVAVGGWVTSFNNKRERQQRFVQQKLSEFYGPLLAIRSRIKAKSELRLKISQLAGEEWPKLIAGLSPEQYEQVRKERFFEYERFIQSENNQLRDEILPAYKEMANILTARMYLADSSTRVHLDELITFVEVWDLWTDRSLPAEVLHRLDHGEKNLYPLYEDLEKRFADLQQSLFDT
jgi:hypothetical protein